MVLSERFELSTSSLPMRCSTPELRQPGAVCFARRRGHAMKWRAGASALAHGGTDDSSCVAGLWQVRVSRMASVERRRRGKGRMSAQEREERLKRLLRENLKRRKAKARAGMRESTSKERVEQKTETREDVGIREK